MYEQEFENQHPEEITKEYTKAHIENRRIALLHEMRVLAEIIRGWSDKQIATFSGGVIGIADTASYSLRQHIMKTYKKFDTLKQEVSNVNVQFLDGPDNPLSSGSKFPDSPVVGQTFFRVDLEETYFFNGTAWINQK